MIKYVIIDAKDKTYLTTDGYGTAKWTNSFRDAAFFESEAVAEKYIYDYTCDGGMQLYIEIRKIHVFC